METSFQFGVRPIVKFVDPTLVGSTNLTTNLTMGPIYLTTNLTMGRDRLVPLRRQLAYSISCTMSITMYAMV